MKIGAYYSHLNGWEWLKVRREGLWEEIVKVITEIDAEKCRTKVSKEKTMVGQLLYSPKDLNAEFKARFTSLHWEPRKAGYWVTAEEALIRDTVRLPARAQLEAIRAAGHEAIYSYNQTDFVKNRVAVEVQFGKYSFIPYDLFVKHMAFFVGNEIDLGVEILPMKKLQAAMSSGPGYYEGSLYDIIRQGRGVPAVPLVLIGIEPDLRLPEPVELVHSDEPAAALEAMAKALEEEGHGLPWDEPEDG